MFTLEDFIRESNRIEGINREATSEEIREYKIILALDNLSVQDMEQFVFFVADARLRRKVGINVQVGGHIPSPGGPFIEEELGKLLGDAHISPSPYEIHLRYETLHPFSDGNGRSGRVLWLWQMGGIENAPLGFLHHFYYQTLSGLRRS